MAKLSAHKIMHHYVDPTSGRLLAVCEDGVTLSKNVYAPVWKVYARKKPDINLAEWQEKKRAAYAALPAWCRGVKRLPSVEQLEQWSYDSVSKTPSGHRVELDGRGPDGSPSWLVLLKLI